MHSLNHETLQGATKNDFKYIPFIDYLLFKALYNVLKWEGIPGIGAMRLQKKHCEELGLEEHEIKEDRRNVAAFTRYMRALWDRLYVIRKDVDRRWVCLLSYILGEEIVREAYQMFCGSERDFIDTGMIASALQHTELREEGFKAVILTARILEEYRKLKTEEMKRLSLGIE